MRAYTQDARAIEEQEATYTLTDGPVQDKEKLATTQRPERLGRARGGWNEVAFAATELYDEGNTYSEVKKKVSDIVYLRRVEEAKTKGRGEEARGRTIKGPKFFPGNSNFCVRGQICAVFVSHANNEPLIWHSG